MTLQSIYGKFFTMKIDEIGWQKVSAQPRGGCTSSQWQLLVSTDSLTKRLRFLSNHQTQIKLLKTVMAQPSTEESDLIGKGQPVWVRESIHLFQQKTPWVWARVLIPETTLANTGIEIHSDQPLGDTLFQDPQLQRTHLAITALSPDHHYYQQITHYLEVRPEIIWARRSLLWFKQHPLYIAEVFLPDLLAYAQNG